MSCTVGDCFDHLTFSGEEETTEQRNKKARDALSIRSEHTLRSENLPFDIDVVSVSHITH